MTDRRERRGLFDLRRILSDQSEQLCGVGLMAEISKIDDELGADDGTNDDDDDADDDDDEG